ncbi:MAG: NUDIX domain-containing protein [Gammaproteobacteria bacterium]|nr:NUDIX domain-containing protein [Gammaproteobacteria bacterium]
MNHAFNFCPRCARPLERRHEGERPRLACPDRACGYVHWDNPTPVVAAIVEHEGKIILARNKAWPEKFFALITGFLERNEKPDEAVLREVEEELSLKAHTPSFVGHYIFDRMNQLILAYHVLAEGTVRLGEELAEWKHVEPARLRPWPAATGLALRDWMLSRGYAPPAQASRPGA